jgi:hypothetical protein
MKMTELTTEQAMDAVYASLINDNEDIDLHIKNLKTALAKTGDKQIEVDPDRLAQNNRSGRKMMQSYFKKRGVKVVFKGK